MITIPDIVKTDSAAWQSIMTMYDVIINRGLFCSETFKKPHREYLLAYISKKNNCNKCYIDHKNHVEDTMDAEILSLTDELLTGKTVSLDDSLLIKQIVYTIGLAKNINFIVSAYNIKE